MVQLLARTAPSWNDLVYRQISTITIKTLSVGGVDRELMYWWLKCRDDKAPGLIPYRKMLTIPCCYCGEAFRYIFPSQCRRLERRNFVNQKEPKWDVTMSLE